MKETVKSHFRATWAYLDGDDYVSITLNYTANTCLFCETTQMGLSVSGGVHVYFPTFAGAHIAYPGGWPG